MRNRHKEPVGSLRALLGNDSLYQQTGLADHDSRRLARIRAAMSVAAPPPGDTLWQATWRRLVGSPAIAVEEAIRILHGARSIGRKHLGALNVFQVHYANPRRWASSRASWSGWRPCCSGAS